MKIQIQPQKYFGPIVILVYYVHATLESCSRNEHVVAENYMIDTRPLLYCCFALDKERQYYLTFFQGLPNYCKFFAFFIKLHLEWEIQVGQLFFWVQRSKGQLISKGHFGFFNSPKKRTKNFCPSRLGQNFEFSRSFFGRIGDTKKMFWN